jgi:hypothetical protein
MSMKHIVFSVMLAVAPTAFGQAKPEPAKPEAKAVEPKAAEPKAAEPKAAAKPAVARKASPKRHEDARQCLERSTNSEIIKCAEEYL